MRTKQEYKDNLNLIKRILYINLTEYNFKLITPRIEIIQELIDNLKENE